MKKHLHNSLRALFLSLAVLLSSPMLALEVMIDGIRYELKADAKQATVVAKSDKYSGDVVILESVELGGTAYSVTSIGDHAFLDCSGLTSVTIPNSVTSIGYQAFSLCSGLTSVTIGNSVESIEPEAFYACSGLTSVTIPNSVTSIGYQAFCYCSGLTSVTIPNSVTSIGDYAFGYCSGLTSVTIGNGVESIGQLAFANCPELLDVYCYAVEVPSTESNAFDGSYTKNPTLHVPTASVGRYTETAPWKDFGTIDAIPPFSGEVEIDGINYDLNAETTQAAVIKKSSGGYYGDVVIPESVEFGSTAYSVTSIGGYAFMGCSGLTSVTIPNSVTSIGNDAFYRCSDLTSVHIYDIAAWCNIDFADYDSNPLDYAHHLYLNGEEVKDLVIPNSVTSIKNYVFYDCSGLTSVTIPNSVTSIGNDAFYGCSGLTSVTIPNSVESIGEYAFAYCSGLTSVTIGNGVESIGRLAFRECSKLSDVYCYAEIVPSTESNAFGDSPIGTATLYVPAGSVDSYKNAEPWSVFGTIDAIPPFSGEVEIDGINYELNGETKQATVIEKSGGEYSGSIVIPESVEYNGTTYSVTSIGDHAFDGCSGLTSVTIPNNVTSIGDRAFRDCSGLTSVTIPNSVASIGNYAFYHCSGLTSVHISDIAAWCNIDFGGEYSNPLSYANLLYLNGVEVKDLVIPNSVTSIGGGAFSNCSGLTSVTIPNSVTSIGEKAFLGCYGLTSVTIGNSVESIGSSAFLGCSALPSVTIPNSVKSIGNAAFSGCSDLTSVTIPNSVTSIRHTAFSNCSALTSVTIGNGVESIEWGAFSWCESLTTVTIPNSVTSIGQLAFEGCSGLTSVHISDIIAWCNIEFGDCYSNPLYYAHHLHLNGEEAKDLVIPNSVTSIGDGAFWGCSGLTSVTIPNSVTSIGGWAFCDCSGLASATIGNSVASIGDGAFSGCSGLTSVTIPNSVTSIGSSAFESCERLTSVTIGNGVTSIGDRAFYYCYKLLDVYCYAEKVPSTESDAFDADGIANATLHVPANAVKSYGASWTSFGTISGTVEVSSVGYATLFLDYDAEIPKGIEAYIAKEVVGENLKMEKVENQEGLLPAETGVIIKAEAGKYDFNLYPNANSVSVDGNLFVGSAIETEITAEDNTSYYILAAPDDNVGMYPVELDENGAFVCKANKAYLPISSAPARIYFDFGTETGILETENGNVKTENCYDLSGRRVQNAQKGIFIVNGKKVVK